MRPRKSEEEEEAEIEAEGMVAPGWKKTSSREQQRPSTIIG